MYRASAEATSKAAPKRDRPAGLRAGATLSRVDGPLDSLALVAAELAEAEMALRALVHSDVSEVPAIAGYLLDAGGKRIRPALTALGARAVGFEGDVARLMCVGELLHLGSLLHDDVVDDGVRRRGRPAAHRVYGNAVTVLTGDFCLARAVLLAAQTGGHRAVTELGHVVTQMAEGEVLQLRRAGDLSCSVDAYLEVIDRKSAALISWCAAAAAWSKGDEASARALARFGRQTGVAFQVTDDVLDYLPGTGKAPGADLRERKVTLPLLFALGVDPGLRDALSEPPSDDALPGLIQRVRDTGALERALEAAGDLAGEGIEALQALPDSAARRALETLGRYLVERAS